MSGLCIVQQGERYIASFSSLNSYKYVPNVLIL
jgi:hypothetical protein